MGSYSIHEGDGDPGAPEVIPGEEARSRFYEAYKRESNRFDKEFKEYNKELNITLLFSALFAVVASTFLRLEQNTNLLAWDNPQAAFTITTIVFCSLVASLFVAFLVIFAKQSLKRYAVLTIKQPKTYRPMVPSLSDTMNLGGL